ncbi:nitrogenase component 1 [Rhodospirillum rubrum]|uniref:Oxidoreductase/nitrogenase, component 1 n=1 Tax=Rhodospirillum rubrum (strain ATCC 11170 / ATH 1.1.1 / DSM 467 / LMG 4362 / NCIMB 8255 / S1) TaxID=269796 RepID=Q2RWB9_RHORT|nr:nitrogenase component 1 [Rhodospirillum rubrum]ABC21576.1 Oxidoreductase/nitrogenase, component 1 [Rhodospirillum rubrum ATCC 11170]AEO47262.1 oxidoreductase/nitrogenase, component 1 [Rhodospirillum rubrum F11]MBK5955812.1 hydrogenase [Rhodospirillum rubrum]QXG81246.1 hydrogenase [Rhodospirillum rubrum]HAP98505.1 hydrogenase [Rhodospirillum rubrum]
MTALVEQPRQLCALGGQQSVCAIERAIPIVHAGPGCAIKLHCGLSEANGYQGSGYSGGAAVVSTNSGEREVVFGGEESLRKVIAGALKVMDGDLFVVLTGCTSELIGDDSARVVAEFRAKGAPIVHAATGGFRGSNLLGHDTVAKAIIDQLLDPAPQTVPGLVNVWASVPYQDPFWRGNLQAIRALLASLGLTVNILFGPGSGGLAAWKQIPAAQFNLVLSSWTGLAPAQALEKRFGTPWLHYPVLPIGALETGRFLRAVAAFAGLAPARAETVIAAQETIYYDHYQRLAEFLLEARCDLPARFVTVTDSFQGLGIARLLTNEFGILPGPQFVTDTPPEALRPAIIEGYASLADKIGASVHFTEDGEVIRQTLRAAHHRFGAPMVFGSAWDREITQDLGGLHLSVAAPASDRFVLGCSYVGYDGALRLLEDAITHKLQQAA